MEKDYFEQYMTYLDDLYEHDSALAVKKADHYLNMLTRKHRILPRMSEEQLDTFLVCIGCILIVLCGFINFGEGMYFVGLIFFMVGFLAGLYVPVFGLIFLFSHGIVGFSMMNSELIETIKNSPILSDGGALNNPYVASTLFLLGFSILLIILQSIIPKIRGIKHIKPIIVFMFLLGMFLLRILPYKLGL